jgi:hypothetical protein
MIGIYWGVGNETTLSRKDYPKMFSGKHGQTVFIGRAVFSLS